MGTTAKISRAQTEVWEWKEKASEELNKLSKEERIVSLEKYKKAFLDHVKKIDKHKTDATLH
ncbi:hypothetical protein BH20BAC1_BH20BAC1_15460 [soil metagenome]|jgi:hypothetical protein